MPLSITDEMLEKNPFFQKGKQEGLQEGLQKGLQEAVVRMYEKLNLPPEQIASVLDIDLKTVKQILKEKE
ncbi:MAG: hypothetical protein GXO22_06185 [Aquificae bacterium]|nr:hypothetical protein [Aquificota bacterium]